MSDKKVQELKEALQEISECLDGFYNNDNPRKLHPELSKFAGYINVMAKTCHNALKDE